MCGIAGFYSRTKENLISQDKLDFMRDSMVHRGPDDFGTEIFENGAVGLAHRRLAIQDLSPAGHEPISYKNGQLWLTFNGEIYNFKELRSELEKFGFDFNTQCDAEVILAAYNHWGEKCVQHFVGMWAFAIWDKGKKQLFCSRDRFGIKPFYYYTSDQIFIFASEIRAILASDKCKNELAPQAAKSFFSTGVVDGYENTFFKDILRLPPGHSLIVSENGIEMSRYSEFTPSDELKNSDAFIEKFKKTFDQAVNSHMIADTPVGICLSGGLDSSSVAQVISENQSTPINAFTSYFEGEAYDETKWYHLVADACNAEKYLTNPKIDDIIPLLEKIIWHLEEPPFAPGVVPQWHVMQLAGQHVKVVVDGQGGDELLAGYGHYPDLYLKDCLKSGRDLFISEKNALDTNKVNSSSLYKLAMDAGYPDIAAEFKSKTINSKNEAKHKSTPPSASEGLGHVILESMALNTPVRHESESCLNSRLHYDISFQMLPALLKYEDKIGMAFSIESRIPFLDHRLVELCLKASPFLKISNGFSKYLLRKIMDKRLPDEVCWRTDKKGFATPFEEWFKGDSLKQIEEYLLASKAMNDGLFNKQKISLFITQHRKGTYTISRHLWQWLCFAIWYESKDNLFRKSTPET